MTALLLSLVLSSPPRLLVEVDGEGYLRFSRDGAMLYAKRAELTVIDGRLCHASGAVLAPSLAVSAAAKAIAVDLEGRVSIDGRPAGRLVLAMLSSTRLAGPFVSGLSRGIGNPGEGIYGVIRAGQPKAEASTVTIRLRPSSEVEGDSIRLGDVAEIVAPAPVRETIAAVDLGRTPPIGIPRGLDRIRVLARLRAEGLAPEKWQIEVPAGATVLRKANRIDPDQLATLALDFVRERLGDAVPLQARTSLAAWNLPPGKVEITGESLSQTASQVTVSLVARLDGKVVGRRSIALGLDATAPSFKVGAIVKVRVRAGTAAVETMGKVKQGGFVGQEIVVETREGALLTGRGIAAGIVEVKS